MYVMRRYTPGISDRKYRSGLSGLGLADFPNSPLFKRAMVNTYLAIALFYIHLHLKVEEALSAIPYIKILLNDHLNGK